MSKLNFLRRLDYFGVNQTFRVNAREKYTSRLGGIVFLSYIVFALAFSFYSFKSYVNKEIKTAILSQQIIIPASDLNLKKLNFALAFGIVFDNNGTVASDKLSKYFDYTINYVAITNNTKSKAKLILTECDQFDFPQIDSNIFKLQALDTYRCLNDTNYTIGGIYTDTTFKYIEYTIALKSTVVSDATTFSTLKKILQDYPLKVNMAFIDVSLDVNNLSKPSSVYLNSVTNYIALNQYQKLNLDFNVLNFTDDSSIILDKPDTTSYMKFNSQMNYYFTLDDRNNTLNSDKFNLYRLYIRSNQQVTSVVRQFQKATTFVANISGILSNTLVILILVVFQINEFKLKQSLINKILNFKEHVINKDDIRHKFKLILRENREKFNHVMRMQTQQKFSNNNVNEEISDPTSSGSKTAQRLVIYYLICRQIMKGLIVKYS